jgi:hypothetical protein
MPGCNSEEIITEQDKRYLIIELLKEVIPKLDRKERKILWLYINGKSFRDISERTKCSFRNIPNIIDKLSEKAKTFCTPSTYILLREYLLDNPSMKEANTPEHIAGWLCIRLQKVGVLRKRIVKNNKGKKNKEEWDISHNKFVWKTKTECRIPEYIKRSFHKEISCGMCGNHCTRKKDNKGVIHKDVM